MKLPRSNDILVSVVVFDHTNLLKGTRSPGGKADSRFETGNTQMNPEYLVGPKNKEARKPAKTNRVLELRTKLKRLPLAKAGTR